MAGAAASVALQVGPDALHALHALSLAGLHGAVKFLVQGGGFDGGGDGFGGLEGRCLR